VRFYECIGSQRWGIYRLIAAEVSSGMDFAVESWMVQVEEALHDPKLTTLGRMNSGEGSSGPLQRPARQR
jgi:hypothetical protein